MVNIIFLVSDRCTILRRGNDCLSRTMLTPAVSAMFRRAFSVDEPEKLTCPSDPNTSLSLQRTDTWRSFSSSSQR
jgi:hypothetical protein